MRAVRFAAGFLVFFWGYLTMGMGLGRDWLAVVLAAVGLLAMAVGAALGERALGGGKPRGAWT